MMIMKTNQNHMARYIFSLMMFWMQLKGNKTISKIISSNQCHLSEDTETIMSLFVSGRTHVRNITRHFRWKYGTQWVPGVIKIFRDDSLIILILPQHQIFVLPVSKTPAIVFHNFPAKPAKLVV